MQEEQLTHLKEKETIIFNVLRGGLNFGLREALADALDWNSHGSSFISAQRARISKDSENWHIVESDYKKVYMPKTASIILGDVVATGTSLEHALYALLESAESQGVSLKSILFVTIGGNRSEEILELIDEECRKKFPSYERTSVCYIEGRFTVPTVNTKLNIRITGTDLIRLNALMAPEFVESQYENPAFPIERCTIYDAGSRAFWIPEYLQDVKSYWENTLSLAKYGLTYEKLLEERFPELDIHKFQNIDLISLCSEQVDKYTKYLGDTNETK